MKVVKSAEMAWLRVGESERAIHVAGKAPEPAHRGCSFFAPDFALKTPHPWLVGEAVQLEISPQPLVSLKARRLPDANDFLATHAEILGCIQAQEFSKVVPIVGEQLEFTAPLAAEMFMPAALVVRENQFNYGFEYGGEGMCGVTPELLFSLRGRHLQTMALAGTGPSDGPSLLDNKKERLEHQLVIEHIVTELSIWGLAEVGTTIERKYGALKHLYTPIDLYLNRAANFMDLVRRLHPTAALGGWPRLPALNWLERQKSQCMRQRFGAPFGYQADGEMACVVAIRGIQWAGAHAQLMVGAGIVRESEAPREWSELQLKLASTRSLLGLHA